MIKLQNATIHHGSNLDVLPTLADNSVDSIVTDPPYELGFMGKTWDSSGIAYDVQLWRECLRVLKPGGHLLAFGGSRTWHRLAVAIEDAGFEIRDSIAWIYGSGFPKSLNISKAIDKQAGAADQAREWDGWGTALKPAFEPIVMARKPIIGNVATNVLRWGVGGLNIDASRIEFATNEKDNRVGTDFVSNGGDASNNANDNQIPNQHYVRMYKSNGRWPANIILDEYTAELLDEQSGVSTSLSHNRPQATKWGFGVNQDNSNQYDYQTGQTGYGDTGGASRFFYVAKANKKDRNDGLEQLPTRRASAMGYDIGLGQAGEGMFKDRDPQKQNFHPTVKPTKLMEYLIKLVTPANGLVLDPFTGSGSTGKAALLNGYRFIGIELTAEYLPIIEHRLKHAADQAGAAKDQTLF